MADHTIVKAVPVVKILSVARQGLAGPGSTRASLGLATTDSPTFAGATLAGLLTVPGGVITPKIYPASDSTTAVGIFKADGTTSVLNVDTTNGRVGIGGTPVVQFDVVGGQTRFRPTASTSVYGYDHVATSLASGLILRLGAVTAVSNGISVIQNASSKVLIGIDPGAGGSISFTQGVTNFADTTASTSTTTGALTVAGGLGVSGNSYLTQVILYNLYVTNTHIYGGSSNSFIDFPSNGAQTSTSGMIKFVSILPTYNQASGTAANTDLLINRTQTAVGSGAQLLIDAQVGGTSKFSVSNTGALVTAAGFGCNGKTAQTAVTVSADATDLATSLTLLNQIRAALIANGIAA